MVLISEIDSLDKGFVRFSVARIRPNLDPKIEKLLERAPVKHGEANTRLLTVDQAADQLGVKPSTIRSWILRREKIEVVKVGRLVRVTETSIQKFIVNNTIPPIR